MKRKCYIKWVTFFLLYLIMFLGKENYCSIEAKAAEIETESNEDEQDEITSGTCGDSATWTLNNTTGELRIEGSGCVNRVRWTRENVKTIYIGEDISEIKINLSNPYTQKRHTQLSDFIVSEENQYLMVDDGVLFSKDGTTLILYPTAKEQSFYNIPEGVTNIGDNAFYGCGKLTEISFPNSLQEIGKKAFQACTKLLEINLPESVHTIKSYAFSCCHSLSTVTIPASVKYIGEYAFEYSIPFEGSTGLKSVKILGKDTEMASRVFGQCESLESVEIACNVGEYAFRNCTSLKNVSIEEGAKKISAHAFEGCSNLEYIEFPESMETLEYGVFCGCSSIQELHISKNVKEMDGRTFYSTNLSKITVDSENQYFSVEDDVLFNKNKTKLVKYPSGKKNETCYILPEGVTDIGTYAFNKCDSLEEIKIPKEVAVIESYVFTGCTSLKSMVLPNGVAQMSGGVFGGCTSLEYVIIPKSVEEIGSYKIYGGMFDGCNSLQKIYGYAGTEIETYIGNSQDFVTLDEGISVIFDANGGTVGEKTKTVFPAYTYGELPIPKKSGYLFEGWYTSVNEGEKITEDTLVEEVNEHTLYAHWVENTTINDISTCTISLTTSCIYNGNPQVPEILIKDGNTILNEGVDYTVEYSNNINAGTGTIVVCGVGKYTGNRSENFKISKASQNIKLTTEIFTLKVGETLAVNATAYGTITYSTDDENIVFVNSMGTISGVSAGNANIRITATGDNNHTSATKVISVNVVKGEEINLSTLTYKFSNSRKGFDYDFSYKIPLSSYQIIFNDTLSKYFYRISSGWGGSCYGMASTAAMFNIGENDIMISDFNSIAEAVSDLENINRNVKLNITVKQFIEAMQVSQKDNTIANERYKNKNNIEELCKLVKSVENGGTPAIICIYGLDESGNQSGHAVVGYEIKKINDSTSRLYVYDCNYPNIERYITLKTNSSGSYVGWYYYLNDNYHWGTDYEKSWISYVPYSVYQSVWENRASATNNNTNIVSVNSDSFEIKDYAGNVIASVENGVLKTEVSNIYQNVLVDAENNTNLLYMPTDVYTIVNNEENIEELEVSVANVEQSATIQTSANEIAFAVVDEEEVNTVSVVAEKEDYYNVTLNSSLECDKDKEETEIKGKGDGNAVTVGMSGGNIILNNGVDVVVKINGTVVDNETIKPTPTIVPTVTMALQKVGSKVQDVSTNGEYKFKDSENVEYVKPIEQKSTIKIPATITIGDTTYKVTSVSKNAFKNNKELTKVTIGSNITTIGASAFSGCSKLKTVTIGKKVTTIGDKAFYKCTALSKITIPSKVKKIGKQTFYGCKKLKSVTIKTTKLTSKNVGSKAFKGIYSKAKIKVPKSKVKAYKKLLKSKGVGSKAVIKK